MRDVSVQQAAKLSLHTIDGQPAEELRVFPPAELDAVHDPNVIVDKMSTLEVQCGQIKPNLGAIVEYKKKVRCLGGVLVLNHNFDSFIVKPVHSFLISQFSNVKEI